MIGRMDSLLRDVQNVTKDIQDLKSSLQFSQDDLDDMKAKSDTSAEKLQVI